MAEIDKNPKQICFMRHQTQTMLENLVFVNDDGTTRLTLDPTNTDQGFISYYKPSTPSAADDYFSFDSLDYSISLSMLQDGEILVNGSGELYNNLIRTYAQLDQGDFEITFNIVTSRKMTDSVDIWTMLVNHIYPACGVFNDADVNPKAYPMIYITAEQDGNFIFKAADGAIKHTIGKTLPNLKIDAIPLTNVANE